MDHYNTHKQLFKKSKKKSKSEKMISFPFATRPPNIRIPLLWKNTSTSCCTRKYYDYCQLKSSLWVKLFD